MGLLASLALTALGTYLQNKATSDALRKKSNILSSGERERARRAEEEFKPMFQRAVQETGQESQTQNIAEQEVSIRDLLDQTDAQSDAGLASGLDVAGKTPAEFTKLANDLRAAGEERRGTDRDAFIKFLAPGMATGPVSQSLSDLRLGRGQLSDELTADRQITNMQASAVRPNQTMQTLATMLKVAAMVSGFGSGAESGASSKAIGADQLSPDFFSNAGATGGTAGGTITGGAGTAGSGSALHGGKLSSMLANRPDTSMGIWAPKAVNPFNYSYF